MGFLGGSVVKNLPANAGDISLIPGSGRSPGEGNGNSLQYSPLAGYNPWGPEKVRHRVWQLNNNPTGFEVVSHCGFDLYFSDYILRTFNIFYYVSAPPQTSQIFQKGLFLWLVYMIVENQGSSKSQVYNKNSIYINGLFLFILFWFWTCSLFEINWLKQTLQYT